MTKHILIGLILLLSSSSLQAQKNKIALQANIAYQQLFSPFATLSLVGPAPSIVFFKPNRSKHQIEWANISYGTTGTGLIETTNFSNAFRYEISRELYRAKERTSYYLGLSTTWYQFGFQTFPTMPDVFLTRAIGTGFRFHIVPSMINDLTDRIYIEVGLPLQLAVTDFRLTRIEDPSMPLRTGLDTFEMDQQFGGGFMLRVGVGVRL
ncbi:MAG: hypothetical protein AB8H47_10350 [Bacteroidia bacterium]